ncbi:MAG: TIGR03960 family B12-binding radical SAM protein [Clostridia bacterium]|nr:TIGR03960 family B12-binding radical SAM protein [Clostridia bacterium]
MGGLDPKRIREEILPRVRKPSRYLGNEWNVIVKPWNTVSVRMVFAFPDLYEVGMSHLGLQILYGLVNSYPDLLMERTFMPAPDMEEELKKNGLPLFSWESYRPLADFDVIGFTLQYEMTYTNILRMLALAGIPWRSAHRSDQHPLVIAGGPVATNPEPLADFIDCFLIGDGEELLPQFLRRVAELKDSNRQEQLIQLAQIPGVYVPSLYQAEFQENGHMVGLKPRLSGLPFPIVRRVLTNFDQAYFPTRPIVPFMEVVHDRIMLEVMRGCTRGCRFCQAGMIYRPVRERGLKTLLDQAKQLVESTGHREISLASLSTADYSCVGPLVASLIAAYRKQGVGVSLPSLRADAFSVELAKQIQKVRKTTLTFAPEAGTQRLRDVINKGVTEKDLLEAVGAAFSAGWMGVKLYFMIGLPTETVEDLDGIADLARQVVRVGEKIVRPKGRLEVTVSASSFVPKPHTPFQWEPQDRLEELKRKQSHLRRALKGCHLKFHWHDPELSTLEAVFSRGDRRLGSVLEEAVSRGAKLDSWSEYFSFDTWRQAFTATGIDPQDYAYRRYSYDEVLPWDHIDVGVSKQFLAREHQRAMAGVTTKDCRRDQCSGCAVCQHLGVDLELEQEQGEGESGLGPSAAGVR